MKKLREKLSARLSKNGGFTLVEMLIVVAIIAILIAVSIPLVNSALEDARESADAANERSAVGVAMVEVVTKGTLGGVAPTETNKVVYAEYIIDNSEGYLGTGSTSAITTGTGKAYGKGTAVSGSYGVTTDRTKSVIIVKYDSSKTDKDAFTTEWVTGT